MKKVLVIGDYIVDRYHMHTATRLCPEGPVPVLHRTRPAYDKPGGAGLVYEQLKAFGGLEVQAIFTSQSRKERFFADNHLLLRVDEDSEMTVREENVIEELQKVLPSMDAAVVSDYGKGGMTENIAGALYDSNALVFVDAKNHWTRYYGAFAAFPNDKEWHTHRGNIWTLFKHTVVKHGSAGCTVDSREVPTINVPVRDVTGAGDVFLAAFVRHYLEQKDLMQAARHANRIAGISVQHTGTYVVPAQDAAIHFSEMNLAA